MEPEILLHHFSPYLATDRFRALLHNSDLPAQSEGAALLVDISGFTPLAQRLVVEFGPERASEELKRRLNPMFEAIAGQVFHHGGSVIRFTGDGFIAWFDDNNVDQMSAANVPAFLRAISAGLEMQAVMPLFRGLRLKICVGAGTSYRWVVGHPQHGLTDVLLGPAVEAMISLTGEANPGQVIVHRDMISPLRSENVNLEITDTGNAIIKNLPDAISKSARLHRWPAWAVEGNAHDILNAVRPFVNSAIRERIEGGLGDFVAELRHAIPMFIQINGVTPENPDARGLLDGYVRTAQSVLASFGGRFVSVEVGDKGSVMFAVFGAPISYGDDAERAVRAAMALREMSSGPDNSGVERIGMSRGQLYAGTVGGEVRHEYSTIGDETNIASRLMSAAEHRQILTTSRVRNEVGPRIAFHDLPPLTVKGREESISVTEPLSILLGGQQQSHVGELIGRESELNQLHKTMKAVRKGYPRIVRIEGQAGVGKSRLVAEMVRLAASQEFRAAGGDCVSTGRNIPYLPWRDVMFSLMGLQFDADLEENTRRIYDYVGDIDPEWVSRAPLLGDLLQLPIPDIPTTAVLEGRTRSQALIALVIDLLLNMAKQQALLIVLEDTHWIDEVSEVLTIELARRLIVQPAPIMLLLVHRPLIESDSANTMIKVLSELHIHSEMIVDELSRPAVTELLESYLNASMPPELSRFVYERAQGNPFYIQEVVDTLRETGFIKVIGSLVFVEKDLQKANLPRTIQKIIQARIDRLTELDKLVLKVAAVIGREFQVRVLAKSIPVPMDYNELLDCLRTLEERDFSYQEAPDPELTYLFKHAITQEVTYQSLLFAQRSQLHHAVASTLEVLAPEAVEQLAYHYARSGDKDHARHYLLLAGEEAFRDYANQSALSYFTEALELALDDEQRFEISRRRMQILLRMGDTQTVKRELPSLHELASRNERNDWHAVVHVFWANYYTQTSAWPNVIDEAQRAASLAQQSNDDLLWEAYLLLREAFLGINQHEEAEYLSAMMEPIAARSGDEHRRIRLELLRIEDTYHEDPHTALKNAYTANETARSLQDPVLEADSWALLARLHVRANNLPGALQAYRQQLDLLRETGDRRMEGLTLLNIGSVLVSMGELSEGNAHLLDAYKILHQIGERAGEASSLVNLGVIAQHHKAYDEALAYMNRGLSLQRTLNMEADIARTLFHMANVFIMKKDTETALPIIEEAMSLFEASNLPRCVDELYLALAEISMLADDLEQAQEYIAPLLPRLKLGQISDLLIPGLAYWRCVQVLEKCGEPENAKKVRIAFRSQAEVIFVSLTPERRDNFVNRIWYHAALF